MNLTFIRNLGGFTKKCQKITPKNFDISNFLPEKIIIDSIFRGKFLYYVKKLPQKFWPLKNFLLIKNLSKNFTALTFIRNLGGFTKKC